MIAENSRYADTTTITENGDTYYDVWNRIDELRRIKDTIRYTWHTVISGEVGCMDLIAVRYYLNERLGWIITAFNEIIDPVSEMYAGQQIRIPDKLFVTAFLTRS